MTDVSDLYDSVQGDLFELAFGEQIHIGGFDASVTLADQAGIRPEQHGVDLCCCNGAGMRFLVRFRGVASMTGVDISERVIERGRGRCRDEGLADRIDFVHADACASGLEDGAADFVWSEDAWVYVPDKPRLVEEAARIVRPGGTIAFTDWVEGPAGLSAAEAGPLSAALKFPNLETIDGYRALLEKAGCEVERAEDTGAFGPQMDAIAAGLETQHKYDALRLLGFNEELVQATTEGFRTLARHGHDRKLQQARFIAFRRTGPSGPRRPPRP